MTKKIKLFNTQFNLPLKYWRMNFYHLEQQAPTPKNVHSIRRAFCPSSVPNCDWVFSNFFLKLAIRHSTLAALSMAHRQFFEFVLKMWKQTARDSTAEKKWKSYQFPICKALSNNNKRKLTNIHTTLIKMLCFNCGLVIVLIWRLFE